MFRCRFALTAPLLLTLLTHDARAVLVAGTTGNTSAPSDDPGWANVGSCNSASAIYLGNLWVLTAYHVNTSGAFPVVFGSTAYTVSGPVHRLNNNGVGGMSAQTDLIVFQINADPGLPSLTVSASAPVVGDDIVMIGNGLNRQASRTFWQATMVAGDNNDVWVETTPGLHNVEGFKAGAGATRRWGTNDAEAVNIDVNYGLGDVRSFLSFFDDDLAGRPNEAQGILGDSGGPAFHKNGAQWELSGVMLAVGTEGNPGAFDNPPANSAVFGQHLTLMADLSFYRDQIVALTIPEPSSTVLLAGAAALSLRRRRNCTKR